MAGSTLDSLQRRYMTLLVLRWLPVGLVVPVLVLIFLDRDLSLSEVGPVLAAYSLVTLLAELPTGGMADAYGRRRMLMVSSLLQAGFFALLLSFDGLVITVLAAMLGGASRALDSGPLEAWFVDEARAIDADVDLERRLGRGGAVDGVTLAVGSIIGGLLAASDGNLNVVLSSALAAQLVHLAGTAALMTTTAPTKTGDGEQPPQTTRAVLHQVRTTLRGSATIRILLLAGSGVGIALVAAESLIQPRFADLLEGRSSTTVVLGVVWAAAFGASAVGSEAGPRLRQRTNVRPGRFLLVLGLCQTVGFITIAATTSPVLTAVGIVGVYAVLGMAYPVVSNLLHDHAPSSARTAMVSTRSLTMQTGAFFGSLLLPLLADQASIPVAWLVAAGLTAAAGLTYGRIPPAPCATIRTP